MSRIAEVFFYGMRPGQEFSIDIEPGKTMILKFMALGEPDMEGLRPVFFELNGVPREVRVHDRSIDEIKAVHPKADPQEPGQVGALGSAIVLAPPI